MGTVLNSNRKCKGEPSSVLLGLLKHSGSHLEETFNLYHNQRDTLHMDQKQEDHRHGHARGICQTDYKTHNKGEVHNLLSEL